MKKAIYFWRTMTYLVLLSGAAIILVPFYWMIRSSLMELWQNFIMPPIWIPNPAKFGNYSEALTILPFGRYFLNTIVVVVGSVLGVLITSSLCAFSFARMRWPGRDLVFAMILSSMMLPYAVTLIPTFIGWKFLGALDTFLPLIIPSWFGGGAFNIFLLRQFYMTIPRELDEAAAIDGASYFKIYLRIILPLTKPALIVVGLFAFLFFWNDFLGPLVYLNSEENYTLALGLQLFRGMYNSQWNLMMAAATVVTVPAVIVFLIGQKYFVEGIALTGLKG